MQAPSTWADALGGWRQLTVSPPPSSSFSTSAAPHERTPSFADHAASHSRCVPATGSQPERCAHDASWLCPATARQCSSARTHEALSLRSPSALLPRPLAACPASGFRSRPVQLAHSLEVSPRVCVYPCPTVMHVRCPPVLCPSDTTCPPAGALFSAQDCYRRLCL